MPKNYRLGPSTTAKAVGSVQAADHFSAGEEPCHVGGTVRAYYDAA